MLLATLACTDAAVPHPDAGGLPDTGLGWDAGHGTDAADAGAERAPGALLVVAVNTGDENGEIWVAGTSTAGCPEDLGQRLGPVDTPRQIAVRDDQRELLVAYGNLGRGFGVWQLRRRPGADALEVVEAPHDIGAGWPIGAAYTHRDEAVLAVLRGSAAYLVVLRRDALGRMRPAGEVEIPGGFPIRLARLPGEARRIVVLRSNLVAQEPGQLLLFAAEAPTPGDDIDWTLTSSVQIAPTPIDFDVHPHAPVLYVPTRNLDDPSGEDNLNPSGRLHRVGLDQDRFTTVTTTVVPELGALVRVNPSGTRLALDDPYVVYDERSGVTGTFAVRFSTVELDAHGAVRTAYAGDQDWNLSHIRSMLWWSDEDLVTTEYRTPNQEADATRQNPVITRRSTGDGQWQAACPALWPNAQSVAVKVGAPEAGL